MAKNKKPPKSVTPRQPWTEAFRSGTHTDSNGVEYTYSEADIDTMATRINAQVASGFLPPIVLGHPRTDSPRMGGVVEAHSSGAAPRRLYLRADELTPEFADSVQKGEYKYSSPAFYSDLGLRHWGMLGGANPSVKGMEPMDFGEHEFAEADKGRKIEEIILFQEPLEQMDSIASALMRISWRIQSLGALFSNLRDQMIASGGSVEDADKVYPSYLISSLTGFDLSDVANSLTEPDQPSASSFNEKPSGSVPAGSASPVSGGGSSTGAGGATTANATLTSENERLRQELARRDSEAGEQQFSERLNKLQAEGRLTPAQRTPLEGLYKKFVGEGQQYAEGDPAFAELDALLSSLPKRVEFGEHNREMPTTKNPLIADAEARREKAKQ